MRTRLSSVSLFAALLAALAWPADSAVPLSCEPIKISMCKSLPYNITHFPNALSHYTQSTANESIQQYAQMASNPCSSQLLFFLCAFHLPICAGGFLSKPIRPCRGLCYKVKNDCDGILKKLKLPWPAEARCDKLPADESGVCIQPSNVVPPEKCAPPCPRFRVNFHSFERNLYDFVIRARLESVSRDVNGSRVLKVRIQRVLQKGTQVPLKKRAIERILSVATCNCEKIQKLHVAVTYFMMGHEQNGQLVLTDKGVVETWHGKTWVRHYNKWVARKTRGHQNKGGHSQHHKPTGISRK